MKHWILIGAGGHARAVVEGLQASGEVLAAYVDSAPADWLPGIRRIASDAEVDTESARIIVGLGGLRIHQLERRLAILDDYIRRGAEAPAVVHPRAIVSRTAELAAGVQVLAGAIIQPNTKIGRGVIVNTGAIVEHDSVVEEGTHVAPGAVVLGGCRVGRFAIVGTRAVVLPGKAVPDVTIVRAGDVFPESNKEAV